MLDLLGNISEHVIFVEGSVGTWEIYEKSFVGSFLVWESMWGFYFMNRKIEMLECVSILNIFGIYIYLTYISINTGKSRCESRGAYYVFIYSYIQKSIRNIRIIYWGINCGKCFFCFLGSSWSYNFLGWFKRLFCWGHSGWNSQLGKP